MRILQYHAPGQPELLELPEPEPGPAQALVKVLGVTTCPHWDLHLMAGDPMFPGAVLEYPYTAGQPGHEALGEVVSVGAGVTGLTPGTRVVCWRDRGHGKQGCYAQYVAVDEENLLPVPADLSPARGASLELAMCVQVTMDRLLAADLIAGRHAAVCGLGPAGLVAVQLLQAFGAARVTGIDPLPARRELGASLGADSVCAPGAAELPASRSSPDAFDVTVDCTGLAGAVQDLMARTRTAIAFFGVLREPVRYGFEHFGGLDLLGYGRHNRGAAERALAQILAGRLDLAPLVSAALPLSRYREGVDLLREQKALKICFLPWDA